MLDEHPAITVNAGRPECVLWTPAGLQGLPLPKETGVASSHGGMGVGLELLWERLWGPW